MSSAPKVLIVGGNGLFGRVLIQALSRIGHSVDIACRRPSLITQLPPGVRGVQRVDTLGDDTPTLARTFAPYSIVVNTVGPWKHKEESDSKNTAAMRIAHAAVSSKCHYIDFAETPCHVEQWKGDMQEPAAAHGVVAITGASTSPGVTQAVIQRAIQAIKEHHMPPSTCTSSTTTPRVDIRGVDILVSGAARTRFGMGTLSSVLGTVGNQVTHYRSGSPRQHDVFRNLRRITLPGIPDTRWVGAVDTADISLLRQQYPSISSIRVHAGIGHYLPALGLWSMATLARYGLLPHSWFIQRLLPWIHYLHQRGCDVVPAGGSHDIGALRVCVLAAVNEGEPTVVDMTMIGRDGDGLCIPVSPAAVLVDKLLSSTQGPGLFLSPGAYVAGEPVPNTQASSTSSSSSSSSSSSHASDDAKSMYTIEDLDKYVWQHQDIECREAVRPFRSPLQDCMDRHAFRSIPRMIRESHAYGGHFHGTLDVHALPLFNLLHAALGLPRPTVHSGTLARSQPAYHCEVDVEPCVSVDGSRSDSLVFHRYLHQPASCDERASYYLTSTWHLNNGAITETFAPLRERFALSLSAIPAHSLQPDNGGRTDTTQHSCVDGDTSASDVLGFRIRGRGLAPMPLQRSAPYALRVTVGSVSHVPRGTPDATRDDCRQMELDVRADLPILSAQARFFGYTGALHIRSLVFPQRSEK
eukprot:TRINITY_DN13732_c0_g1_i1.p1 TRINITY_DN13732_c0_g1~~TRINITY_DN13732_c0_g1_i1.p1  ORF type:complete len:705 (+),score=89.07 TRINITY_DN13732_c0_g1_i1:36-2117(+)